MAEEAIDLLVAAINREIDGGALVHTVKAPYSTSVLMNDGRWKTQSITTDVELQFTSVRAGKRSQILFTFEPVDARPYKQVEFDEKKIGEAIPEVVAQVNQVLGAAVDDAFATAKQNFLKSIRKEAAAQAEQERKTSNAKYESNPDWGSF